MTTSRASGGQRLRARARWAFSLAGVCFAATLAGLVQYAFSGAVSIRPGHDAISGSTALESVSGLFAVGVLFAVCGVVFQSRARRH